MPTSREDAILDAAGLVKALVDRDPYFVEAALDAGDTKAMCEVLGGWLGDALRSLRDDHAAAVLAGFRDLARDDGDWADYC